MKKLLLILALCVAASAQEILLPSIGPRIAVAKNVQWIGGPGPTFINNTWRFTPLSASTGVCLYVENADSITHTVSVNAYINGNPSPANVEGIGLGWRGVSVFPNNGSATTIPTLNTQIFYFPIAGASVVKFSLGGGGAAGVNNAANVSIVQVSGGNNCGVITPIVGGGTQSLFTYAPFSCPYSVSNTVATGTTVKLVDITSSAATATSAVHVCAYSISVGGAAVTAATNLFVWGTGATCNVGTTQVWSIQTGTTTAQNFALASSTGQLFAGDYGKDLCYTDAGTTAGTQVNLSYAVW